MVERLLSHWDFWVIWGVLAQLMFTLRFLLQWIASERHGTSIIPVSFWYFSLFGSLGLLVYAIVRADPVFILGQAFGSVVYIRNLMLISRHKTASQAAESGLSKEPQQ
jgi:lipid-A-disaccharide synthase-like uncharacterized protein